jgi:hypothetical protein
MRYELKVNRSELANGLETLRKLVKKPKPNMEAVFSFEDGLLEVYLNGFTVQAHAEGELPGLTRIPGVKAINLSKVLPTDDPLIIALEEERFYIGSLSIPCYWDNVRPRPIEIPNDAPLTTLLGVRLQYSHDDIFASGLLKPVNEAVNKRKMLVKRAANILEPLGVSLEEVERLVDDAVKRANHL